MQPIIYRQKLQGSFKANVIPRGQCGFRRGQKEFEYEASIVVDSLDDNGWIVDNHLLDKMFTEAWCNGDCLYEASCEDLAGGGVKLILDAMGPERALEVTVTIKPNGFAWLSAEWKRGCDNPQWLPRKAEKSEPAERKIAPGLELLPA